MMDQARTEVNAASGSDDAPWGLYCTPTYLAMQEATGWMRLGQADRAVTVSESEIGRLPALDRVDSGVFRARLAHAHAANGQPAYAAKTALAAFELAEVTGSSRARRELAQVRNLIGAHPQTEAAARFAAICDTRTRPARNLGGRP